MAVENRVRDLENEVKILKNEIKTILLNIQDHVLTHYASPFVAVAASQSAAKQAEVDDGSAQSGTTTWEGALTVVDRLEEAVEEIPASDNGAEELVPDKMPEPAPAPEPAPDLMSMMNPTPQPQDDSGGLMDLLQAFTGSPGGGFGQQPQNDDAWLSSLTGGNIDLALLAKLSGWVNSTSRVLGGKRAKAMLDTYAMSGIVSPNVVRLLGLFVKFDSPAPKGKVSNKTLLTALLNLDRALGRKVDPTTMALSLLLDGS